MASWSESCWGPQLGHERARAINLALHRGVELRRAATVAFGIQAIGLVADEPLAELVVERARDAEFLAGCADLPQLPGAPEELKAKGVYPVLEGHWAFSFVLVW
jgi:hypothetical protein